MQSLLKLLLVVTLASCRLFSEHKTLDKKQTLFDQLIAQTPDGKVPYPFAKLLSHLSGYGQPLAVFVPLGYSQFRQDSSFKEPRHIVGFVSPDLTRAETQKRYLNLLRALGRPQLKVGEFTIDSHLFLAYTPQKQQLEVMSLLPGAVAFDYQLVKNYRADSEPFSVAVTTKQCRSCHQRDEPLTRSYRGGASNVTPLIARLIATHHPSGLLEGIPIELDDKKYHKDSKIPVPPFAKTMMKAWNSIVGDTFEHFRDKVGSIVNDNQLWQDGCLKSTTTIACRKLLFWRSFSCYRHPVAMIPPRSCPLKTALTTKRKEPVLPVFVNYINNLPEARSGFSLSDAAKKVVAKIKATKLGDIDPDRHYGTLEPGLYALFSIFLETAGGGVDFPIPDAMPPLSKEDLAIIHREVERLFVHVHGKNLHLNTAVDPASKRKLVKIDRELNRYPAGIDREKVAKIFVQQTILPANKRDTYPRIASPIQDMIYIIFGTPVSELSYPNVSFELAADQILTTKHYPPTTGTCQTTKKLNQCQFKKIPLNVTSCKDCQNAQLDMTMLISQDALIKPPRSVVTLTVGGKQYRFELLCSLMHEAEYFSSRGSVHICTTFDSWQIAESFTQLIADQNSVFYADYYNPSAIFRALLKNLGYTWEW